MDDLRLRAVFGAIDAQDWDAMSAFFHPEVVYERPGTRTVRGVDDLMLFYRAERKVTRSAHHIEGTVVQDGRGAIWGRADCVLADGTHTTIGFADVFEFDEDLIRLRRSHFFVPGV